jgi:hypothetical protein
MDRGLASWVGLFCAPLCATLFTAAGGGSGEPVPVQREPQVTGSRHDSSKPLRDLPPAERKPGKRVHPVKRIPRPAPKPSPEGGSLR